jgi:hypothetical protein
MDLRPLQRSEELINPERFPMYLIILSLNCFHRARHPRLARVG